MKERKYPEYLEEIFGPNLDSIFGTEEEQQNKISLLSIAGDDAKVKEIRTSIENQVHKGVLDVYEVFGKNARPSFIEVGKRILKILQATKLPNNKLLFDVYKLPNLGTQNQREGGAPVSWEKLYLRYPIQRAVKIWHIVEDILIDWDYNLNDPAYVRILEDGTMNVNDKQHGNFGRLIMGAPDVLVEGIYSDDPSDDSNMYASRNIHNLESGWENDYNVRVERAKDFLKEGKPVKKSDKPYLDFHEILKDEDCEVQEAGLDKKAKHCNNGEKLYKDYQHYGSKLFVDAVRMNTQIWPHGELAREFVWFASEAMKQWKDHFTDSEMNDIKSKIKQVMREAFPDDGNASIATGPYSFWQQCLNFKKTLPSKGDKKDFRHSISAGYLGAAGLRDLLLNYNAYIKSTQNRTPLKLDLPLIKDNDDRTVVVKVGFHSEGYTKATKNKKPFMIETETQTSTKPETKKQVVYDASTIVFDDEEEHEVA